MKGDDVTPLLEDTPLLQPESAVEVRSLCERTRISLRTTTRLLCNSPNEKLVGGELVHELLRGENQHPAPVVEALRIEERLRLTHLRE